MKKSFLFVVFLLSTLFVSAQKYDFSIYQDKIEFDITNINIFEHRVHFVHTLNSDLRFDVKTSDKDGVFIIRKSEVSGDLNLSEAFNEFCQEEHAVFSKMTKEEAGDALYEMKAELPDDFVTALMMDIYAKSRQNNLCANADPFCTDNGQYVFPAGVDAGSGETGPDYNCLHSTPNPAWYYMRIGNPGNIDIYMYSTPQKDIDFCCWGPFTDPVEPCPNGLTANKVVSCSYSSNATETCQIPSSALTGEYYILVITNYSNDECNITFSKTGGNGTTDCSIMPPVVWYENPCHGGTLTLHAQEISGASYLWTGPNGFTSTETHPTIQNVSVNNSGTYQCSITVGSSTSDPMSIVVDVIPQLVVDFSTSNSLCAGNEISFTGSVNTTLPDMTMSSPDGRKHGISVTAALP